MATWNIMKSLDDDELRLARSRGADEDALSFLMRPGPDPRWYAMKNWGWIRVHTNTRKAETYFQTLLFDEDSLGVIRNSEFWRKQPKAGDSDWVVVEELSTKKLFPMTAGKLRRGDPDEVLGRAARVASAVPSYREVQQLYPSRENPPVHPKVLESWSWIKMTEDQYEKGHIATGPAERFAWKYVPEYPISKFGTAKEWKEYFKGELEGVDGQWEELLNEYVRDTSIAPVVVVQVNNQAYLWDGSHRVGAAATVGLKHIAAIVGYPVYEVEWTDDYPNPPKKEFFHGTDAV
jgi:hypothetical protein